MEYVEGITLSQHKQKKGPLIDEDKKKINEEKKN